MYTEWFGGPNNTPAPKDLYNMVLPICKHYIRLRYQLMQLFYDALFENTLDGLPICRALFLNDPQDQALYNDKAQFLNDEFFVPGPNRLKTFTSHDLTPPPPPTTNTAARFPLFMPNSEKSKRERSAVRNKGNRKTPIKKYYTFSLKKV